MELKKLVAKAMVVGGLGLPAIGLGIGVANADPTSPPPAPPGNKAVPITTATPFRSTGTVAAAQTGLPTAMANGNKAVPPTTATPFRSTGTVAAAQTRVATAVPATAATPFGGERARSDGGVLPGLNPNPRAGGEGPSPTTLFGALPGLLGIG